MRKAITPAQIAQAHRVIAQMPELSAVAKGAASLLIDHFNRMTGRCDPSIARMARILRVGQATLVRALQEITAAKGTARLKTERGGPAQARRVCVAELFARRSHASYSARNLYVPNWQLFGELAEAYDAARIANRPLPIGSEVITSCDHFRAVDVLRSDQQTQRLKPKDQKPTAPAVPSKERTLPAFAVVEGGLGNGRGGSAARAAAARRLGVDMVAQGVDLHASMIAAHTEELGELAVAAEVKRHGAGVLVYLEALDRTARERIIPEWLRPPSGPAAVGEAGE